MATATIGHVEPFDEGVCDFEDYMERVELFFTANGVAQAKQVPTLLTLIGPKTYKLLKDLLSPQDPKSKTLKEIQDELKGHLTPEPLVIAERFRFHKREQRAREGIKDFIAAIKALAATCKFANFLDEALRDKFVCGLQDTGIQKKLLTEAGLTFKRATEIAVSMETAAKDSCELRGRENSREHSVNFNSVQRVKDCRFCGLDHPQRKCPAYGDTCSLCKMKNHWSTKCEQADKGGSKPKRGRFRSKTPRRHHDRSRSRSRQRSRSPYRGKKNVHQVSRHTDEADMIATLNINSVSQVNQTDEAELTQEITIKSVSRDKGNKRIQAELTISEPVRATLHVQVDTGAEANVLPARCFKQIFPEYVTKDGEVDRSCPDLTPKPFVLLKTYDSTYMKHCGTVHLRCSVGNQTDEVEFFVVDTDGPILLGADSSVILKLITLGPNVQLKTLSIVNIDVKKLETTKTTEPKRPIKDTSDLIAKYPDRFKGLGKFPGQYKIHLKKDATPVVQAPRRCPINLQDEIQKELSNMESQGIISKIPQGQPTEWLHNLAYARKSNGKLRVCLDPRNLNANIKRTYHRAPTVEEVTHKLANASVFSKLDAKNGYWAIELDEESSLLTAFSSPASNQRYMFKRLPFGLNVSQDLFQEAMDQVLWNQPGTLGIADDVIVHGHNDEDHDANLHSLMAKAAEKGLVFNPEKCHIHVPEVPFFGTLYSANGARPDPDRVKEINQLPAPQCKQDLQSFLGMVQYLAPFIPNLSEQTSPMRSLLKKDVDFVFTATHEQAFKRVKECISEATTLRYYDPRLPTKIQVDASLKGLGAALIQEDPDEPGKERVIAYASKSLTPTETRYANIERECLAVVFGVEKFHTYIYGAPTVTVESDHKPLEAIHLKNLAQAPPRLQRMLLRLQPYDIEIRYRKGSELLLADFLSRYHPLNGKEIELEQTVHAVRWSNEKLQQLRTETSDDPTLSELARVVVQGWPQACRDLPAALKPFWTIKDYISIDNGILLKGSQVIVPPNLHEDVLSQLHEQCHQGIEKTRLLARQCVFWPNISQDIATLVGSCTTCNTYQNSLPQEPMWERDIPSEPWEMLGTDLFDFKSEKYLLICDYYSKFVIVRKLTRETSSCIVSHMRQLFNEEGAPTRLYSDNGPCYNSSEFSDFAEEYGFDHITSSPHYPKSNGFAERCVQTVKNLFKKCDSAKCDPGKALLLLRATPIEAGLPSPAELLKGRKVKTTLPTVVKHESQKEEISEKLRSRQQVQKQYHDIGTHKLPDLKPGQPVMLQSPNDLKWSPATVVSPTSEPRSYVVQTTAGSQYRRNRKFLRELPQKTASLEKRTHTDITSTVPVTATPAVAVTATPTTRHLSPLLLHHLRPAPQPGRV